MRDKSKWSKRTLLGSNVIINLETKSRTELGMKNFSKEKNVEEQTQDYKSNWGDQQVYKDRMSLTVAS